MTATILYLIVLFAAFGAGLTTIRNREKRFPYLTVGICLILLVCLILQLIFPDVLLLLERNAVAVREGEWWRVVTALFFQDGWLVGGITNILLLGLVGSIAEQIFKRWQWLVLYFMDGIVTELIALIWQPIGAGNSVAYFALAAGLVCFVFIYHKTARLSLALSTMSALAAAGLLFQEDIHGAAFFIGALGAAALLR